MPRIVNIYEEPTWLRKVGKPHNLYYAVSRSGYGHQVGDIVREDDGYYYVVSIIGEGDEDFIPVLRLTTMKETINDFLNSYYGKEKVQTRG